MAVSYLVESAENALELLRKLYPEGEAWNSYRFTRFLMVLAAEYRRLKTEAVKVVSTELSPLTAVDTLDDWERNLGLPDGCTPPGATLEERQNIAYTRMLATGGQTRAYFISLAETSTGLTDSVRIYEYEPFRVGASRAGDNLYGTSALFDWVMVVYNSPSTDPYPPLECAMQRLKPAHTRLYIAYTTHPPPGPAI